MYGLHVEPFRALSTSNLMYARRQLLCTLPVRVNIVRPAQQTKMQGICLVFTLPLASQQQMCNSLCSHAH